MLLTVLLAVLNGPPTPAGTCTIEGKVTLLRKDDPVSAEGRVVVYFDEKVRRDKTEPRTHTMVQEDLKFRPDVMVIRRGDSIEFVNKDKTEHNVFSLNPYFDKQRSRLGVTGIQQFDVNQAVRVRCDVHGFMHADVLVLEHRSFATVDADGNYRLSGLPEGDRVLRVWERNGTTQQFTVKQCVGVVRAPEQTIVEGPRPQQMKKTEAPSDGEIY